jgi:hypothetical protein
LTTAINKCFHDVRCSPELFRLEAGLKKDWELNMKASNAVFTKQACNDLSNLAQALIQITPYGNFSGIASGKESWADAFS